MELERFEDEERGLIATVSYDEFGYADNPREWDNAWTILTNQGPRCHDIDDTLDPDYCVVECESCDGTGEFPPNLDGPARSACSECDGYGEKHDINAYLQEQHDAHLIVPVYKYEHGLCEFRASQGGNPFHCEWDSGMIGVAIMSRAELHDNWISFGYSEEDAVNHAIECLHGELKDYTDWANGHIYAYTVEDETGEMLDSCGGIFGLDYAIESAKDALEYEQERVDQEREAIRYWQERGVETVG